MRVPSSRDASAKAATGLAIAVLLLALTACGTAPRPVSSSAPPTGSASAAAIADSLSAGGLPCTDLSSRRGVTNVADEARCNVGDDDVIIRTFLTPEDRDRYMEAAGIFVDQLSFDVDAPPQLIGPTWIVTTDTRATAEKIRAILGGSLR